MDTQDIARFAVAALQKPETNNRTFPVVGTRAWGGYEIIRLCERLSGQEAKISRMPIGLLRAFQKGLRFFQWGWNTADRLAFTEVIATGKPLTADMTETYAVFGIDPKEITTLENYMQEYFGRIMKKLKELEYEREKAKEKARKKRSPFKSATAARSTAKATKKE